MLRAAETLLKKTEVLRQYTIAYAGWLMANPVFRAEQRDLNQEFCGDLKRDGFPAKLEIERIQESDFTPFQGRCLQHYQRWILDGVAAPDYPIPVAYRLPDPRHDGERLFGYPAYLPVPGQGVLPDLINGSRPSRDMPQLAEWFEIVERDNARLNRIPGYVRRFHLLHYWRGLFVAFPEGLHRGKTKLIGVFSDFLRATDSTIKTDLKILAPLLSDELISFV